MNMLDELQLTEPQKAIVGKFETELERLTRENFQGLDYTAAFKIFLVISVGFHFNIFCGLDADTQEMENFYKTLSSIIPLLVDAKNKLNINNTLN
jgi:hypothetical protein